MFLSRSGELTGSADDVTLIKDKITELIYERLEVRSTGLGSSVQDRIWNIAKD